MKNPLNLYLKAILNEAISKRFAIRALLGDGKTVRNGRVEIWFRALFNDKLGSLWKIGSQITNVLIS